MDHWEDLAFWRVECNLTMTCSNSIKNKQFRSCPHPTFSQWDPIYVNFVSFEHEPVRTQPVRRSNSAVRIRAHSSRCTPRRGPRCTRAVRARRFGSVHSVVATFSRVDVCMCAHRSRWYSRSGSDARGRLKAAQVRRRLARHADRKASWQQSPQLDSQRAAHSYLGTRRETTSSLLPAGAAGVSAGHQDAQARRAICSQGAIANSARTFVHHHDRAHGSACRRLLLATPFGHD